MDEAHARETRPAHRGAAGRTGFRDWRQTPALRVFSDPSDVESVTIRYLMHALCARGGRGGRR